MFKVHTARSSPAQSKMKSFNLLCLLLLGVVASSIAASVSVEETNDAELVDLEFEDDSDESDDEDERGLFKNSKGEKRCKCNEGNSCECCAAPKLPVVGKVDACLKATLSAADKTVQLEIDAKGKKLIGHKFSLAGTERVCQELPGSMSAMKACLYTDTSDMADKTGIQTCAKVELQTLGKCVAKIVFSCIQLQGNKISLSDAGEVKAKDVFKVKVGDPIKSIIGFFKG
ncbi:hypothetical protein GE061_011165 [Apolygus lucorum]|uniref:DUF4773 domain-containing protein n=1 Tax=Apolygus lucorum TaxID=248454 RepID=A0A8S9XZC7_APOLU|nr:hypothetical protein GE061_011165 [Apolygus lucorum]